MPQWIYSVWLTGLLSMVMCQGCTEETVWEAERPVYSKLLSGLHCSFMSAAHWGIRGFTCASKGHEHRHVNTQRSWQIIYIYIFIGKHIVFVNAYIVWCVLIHALLNKMSWDGLKYSRIWRVVSMMLYWEENDVWAGWVWTAAFTLHYITSPPQIVIASFWWIFDYSGF